MKAEGRRMKEIPGGGLAFLHPSAFILLPSIRRSFALIGRVGPHHNIGRWRRNETPAAAAEAFAAASRAADNPCRWRGGST
jgi:hypothetical protein